MILAVAANLIVYFISRSLFAIDFVIPPAPGTSEVFTISPANVILDTVVMALAATVVFALFSRLLPHPVRLFLIASVIVFTVSLMIPLLLPVELPMKLSLNLMHTIAAVCIVGGLLRFEPT